jgi:cation diffusion facilitator family transporter
MSAPSSGDPKKVVIAALTGNALIAVSKFVAAYLSGSAAMLAEGVHSLADTSNQGLLLLGMGLALRSDPRRYPLGRAKESYFWAFVVALMLFSLGGAFAIYEGIHKLRDLGHEPGSPIVSLVVLVVSLAIEGASFFVAMREFNKTRHGRSFRAALFEGRDPTIPVVVLEDAGAVLGLLVALVAVTLTWVTGSGVYDGIGSLLIGVLLCSVGIMLAFETHGLLIGEGATPETREKALAAAEGTPGVEAVTQILTMHLGPNTILLALKVRFARKSRVEDVERITNQIEERVLAAVPEMKKIFVEADGSYDVTRDPAAAIDGAADGAAE